jgi:hypothetical protein
MVPFATSSSMPLLSNLVREVSNLACFNFLTVYKYRKGVYNIKQFRKLSNADIAIYIIIIS